MRKSREKGREKAVTHRLVEILREFNRVQRRRGDNQLHVVPLSDGLLQQTEQHIGVHSPFVRLVQHDNGVLTEVGVDQAFAEQHALSHVLDLRLGRRAILETDGVTDLLAKSATELLRDLKIEVEHHLQS